MTDNTTESSKERIRSRPIDIFKILYYFNHLWRFRSEILNQATKCVFMLVNM